MQVGQLLENLLTTASITSPSGTRIQSISVGDLRCPMADSSDVPETGWNMSAHQVYKCPEMATLGSENHVTIRLQDEGELRHLKLLLFRKFLLTCPVSTRFSSCDSAHKCGHPPLPVNADAPESLKLNDKLPNVDRTSDVQVRRGIPTGR